MGPRCAARNRHWLGPVGRDLARPGRRPRLLPEPGAALPRPRPGRAGCCRSSIGVDGRIVGQMVLFGISYGSLLSVLRRATGCDESVAGPVVAPDRAGPGRRPRPGRRWGCTASRSTSAPRTPTAWPSCASWASATRGAGGIPAHRRGLARPPDLRPDHRGPRGGRLTLARSELRHSTLTPVTLATHRPTSPAHRRRTPNVVSVQPSSLSSSSSSRSGLPISCSTGSVAASTSPPRARSTSSPRRCACSSAAARCPSPTSRRPHPRSYAVTRLAPRAPRCS